MFLVSDEIDTIPPSRALIPVAGTSTTLRNAVVLLVVIAGGAVVQYLHDIVTPLVIALFLLMLIDGFDRALAHRLPSVPAWLRSTLGAVVTIGGFAIIVGLGAVGARSFGAHLMAIAPKIDALLAALAARVQAPPPNLGDLMRVATSAASLSHVFGAARGFASGSALVVIYLGFLLASRQAFKRKLIRMFGSHGAREHALRVFTRVRSASEQYIGLQTFKAALAAIVSYIAMRVMGLTDPLFLALLVFLASYVPIVGGVVASALPTLIALGELDDPIKAVILFALLVGSLFMIESVLLPKLQGDRLNLDPVAVLLSLGFWGALLGVPGALLSTPLTVVVMAIAAEFDGSRWLAVLVSKEGDLAERETG
jgi:predicted PurR-regulated permease PerM